MRDTPSHLKSLEEVEKTGIPGLVEVLRQEGIDAISMPCGTRPDCLGTTSPAWRNRTAAEQKG
jgi:hypothetical protein